MSALRPEKKPRLTTAATTQGGLKRTESVLTLEDVAVGSVHPTDSHPPSLTTSSAGEKEKEKEKTSFSHPKGHRVKTVEEVWKTMDSQGFLHLTDTWTLYDVWVQPISCVQEKGSILSVLMYQFVIAPHIKCRQATTKMSADDLVKMLYLCDTMCQFINQRENLPFDVWVNEKVASCVKALGVDAGVDKVQFCNFIMQNDPTFTLHPTPNLAVFVRKICYHSYRTSEKKLDNPLMIKCTATRGKFEYVLEVSTFPLCENWKELVEARMDAEGEEKMPVRHPLLL